MPVICIKTLPLSRPLKINEILKRLNLQISDAAGIEPGHIWSYWQFIERHQYAVGDTTAAAMQAKTHSPIIEITGFEGKSNEQIETIMKTVAGTLAAELEIEESNIFITYNEMASGMVFDGGQVVKA
ncbi:MAG: tautomerase family protein [Ignavibacteria bacterium]|nr:tautomerase family protein [Ignavibacteria bacterium]